MAANYRESFIQHDDLDDAIRMPPPAMMEDLKKQLIDEFDVDTTPVKEPAPIKVTPPGYMNVYLKVRPFCDEELTVGESQGCFQDRGNNTVGMHAPKESKTFKNVAHGQGKATHSFTFSHVFGEKTTQKQFFDTCTLPIIKDFINGQNCLMFTYGVTSAGKTYTLLGSPDNAGILPRGLDVVFNSVSGRQMSDCQLMPRLFREVVSMTPRTATMQLRIKEKVLQMATDDEPNMTALLGADAETSTIVPMNDSHRPSNAFSIDSLGSMQSRDSIKSTASSMPSINEDEAVDFQSMERAVHMLAQADNRVREQTRLSVDLASEMKFSIWVSFAEIHNENIYDLLEPLPTKKTARRVVLRLKEDEKGIPFVKGLKWIPVSDGDEAFKILTIGRRNLQVACTKLNKSSSRSHCIFSMKMIRTADISAPHMARVNTLSFVDLAGSERYSKTQNVGAQLREAAHINTSLLTLGRCLETLRFNQHHKMSQKMVPFRESRLTRLFQSFFTGEGKAAMIVNINQNASMFDETLHALKFSAIAKQVTVVQRPEPEKKPPVLKVAVKKNKKKSSFALSKAVRDSVPWGSPGAIQRSMEMEDEAEDEKTFQDCSVDDLLATIEDLTTQLSEEKMKAAMMELKVREEVSAEMSKYIVKIETEYSERFEDARAFDGERADQRLDLYMNTVKKKRRRRDDEEDQLVTKETQLEERNKDLRAKVEELDDELAEARSDLAKALSERDCMREELSTAQFQMAGLKELTTETANKICESELIDNLGRTLEEAQETIREQSEQMVELNELLSEAGQTFHDKEVETERLKATILDGERQLKDQTGTILEMRTMIVEARNTIDLLERRAPQKPADVTNQFDETMNFELREKLVNLEEVLVEKKTTVTTLEEAKTSLMCRKENLETDNRNLMAQLEHTTQRIAQIVDEKSHLAMELNAARVKIHELEEKVEIESKQTNAKKSVERKTNVVKLNQISKDLDAKQSDLRKCDDQLKSLKKDVSEVQKAKAKATNELEKLKDNLSEKRIEKENLNTAFEMSKTSLDQLADEIKAKQAELESLESEVKSGKRGQKNLMDSQKEVTSLKDENEKLNNEIKRRDAEMKTLNDKLEMKKSANQCYYDKMCKLEEELDDVRTAFEKLEDENEELLNERSALEQVAHQLSETVRETHEQLETMTEAVSRLEERLSDVQSEKSCYGDKMKSLKNESSLLVGERTRLEGEVEALNSRTGELYSMLKVANQVEVKLKNEKNERAARIVELEQSLEELDTALSQESQAKSRLEEELAILKKKARKNVEKPSTETSSVQTLEVKFRTEKLDEEMQELTRQRDEFRTKCEESEKEITGLKSGLKDLECVGEERDSLIKDVAGIRKNLAEVEKDRNVLQGGLEKARNELSESSCDLEKVKTELEELRSKLEKSSEEANESSDKSKHLQSENVRLQSEVDELKEKLADSLKTVKEKEEECDARSVAISALNSEITELTNALVAKDDKIQALEKTSNAGLAEQSEKCHELEAKVQELSMKLEKAESSVISAVQGRDRAEEQNETLDQEIQTLRGEYAALLEKYTDEVEVFEKEIEALKSEVDKANKKTTGEVEVFEKEIEALKSEVEKANKKATDEVEVFEKEIEALKSEVDKANKKATDEVEVFEKEIEALKSEVNKANKKATDEVEVFEKEIEALKSEVDKANKKATDEVEVFEKEIEALKSEVDKANKKATDEVEVFEKEIEALKSEVDKANKKATDEAEVFEKEIEALKSEVDKANKKTEDAEENFEKWRTESDEKCAKQSEDGEKRLDSELSCANDRIEELKCEVQGLNADIEGMLCERDEMLAIVRALRKEKLNKCLASETTSLKSIVKKVETVVEGGKKLQIMLRNSRTKNEELQKEIDQLNSRLESQSVSFEKLRSKIEDCEKSEKSSESRKLRDLTDERDTLRTELGSSTKQLAQLRTVNEQLKEGLKEADESAQIEEEERKKLEKQLSELKSRPSLDETWSKSAGRPSRLRLASRTNSTLASPAVKLQFECKGEAAEEEENVDPATEETRLAERCVQANLVSPNSMDEEPSSPDGDVLKPTPARPVRSSARKKAPATRPVTVKTEPASTGRTRKRCLMKTDPLYDVSPDTSLESPQTSIDPSDNDPIEASVRRRLRTRRK